jgi:ribosomal protein S27AE
VCDKDKDGNKVWDCGKCDCLTSFANHSPTTDTVDGKTIRVCSKCGTQL